MPESVQIILFAPLGVLIYAGSMFVWPIYRARHRKSTRRGRALFRVFAVQLILYLAWSIVLLNSAVGGGHWLHGVTVFVILNLIFLLIAGLAWSTTDDKQIPPSSGPEA